MTGSQQKAYEKLHKDNRGSTLATTLIATALLLILAGSVLAVSTMNLRTKNIDYLMKQDFYENETFLTDIYNGIGQEATVCFEKAYTGVLRDINQKAPSGEPVYPTEEAAYREFCERFVANLQASFPASDLEAVKKTLNRYATEYKADAAGNAAPGNPVTVTGLSDIEVVDNADAAKKEFVFEKLVVLYEDHSAAGEATGYEAAITTDIVITMPYVSFFDTPDYMADYALIANEGIYFHGVGSRTVNGNVYAGIAPTGTSADPKGCEKDVNGGMNVVDTDVALNGQYIISRGDINVRKGSLLVENGGDASACNVWAESVRTAEGTTRYDIAEHAKITVTGNTFIANDLELNSYNSDVTLAGSFYGYNNGVYATKEDSALTGMQHTLSSAITVNEKQAKLDLTGLDTMFISGLAYIDMNDDMEQKTGESLALQTNQFMYLVPSEFLDTTNPVSVAEAPGIDVNNVPLHITEGWFATGYLDDTVQAVAKKVTTPEGVEMYYFYLNFKAGMERRYAQEILSATQEKVDAAPDSEKLQLKWKLDMKNKLQEKAIQAGYQAIEVSNDADCRVYGLGAITQLDGTSQLSVLDLPDGGADIGTGIGTDYATLLGRPLGNRFKHLYYYLDPQEEYALTSQSITEPTVDAAEEMSLPVSKYVDIAKIAANNPTGTSAGGYEADDEYSTVIVNGNYTVGSGTKITGIVLATGNVTIENNAHVEGMVIANGKIYLEGSGTVTASRAVVQEILEEEMTKEKEKDTADAENKNYACNYLKAYQSLVSHTGVSEAARRENGTDYADYIKYRNWEKGGN